MPPDAARAGPSDRDRLGHMLAAACDGVSFVAGRRRGELDTDAMLRRALVNAIQEIGEAAVRTTPAGRARLTGIDWSPVIRMRNILVHVYWGVDHNHLWQTATEDLAPLAKALESALAAWPE